MGRVPKKDLRPQRRPKRGGPSSEDTFARGHEHLAQEPQRSPGRGIGPKLASTVRKQFFGLRDPADLIVILAAREETAGSWSVVRQIIGFGADMPFVSHDLPPGVSDDLIASLSPEADILQTAEQYADLGARVAPKIKAIWDILKTGGDKR